LRFWDGGYIDNSNIWTTFSSQDSVGIVLVWSLLYGLILWSWQKQRSQHSKMCSVYVLGRGGYFSASSAFEPAQAALLQAITWQYFDLTSAFGRTRFLSYRSPTAVIDPKAKVLANAETRGVEGHAKAEVGDLAGPPNRQVILHAVGRWRRRSA